MILADKIIDERKKNGWSQEDLADKLGVSRQSVSKWESAQSIPDLQRILEMSKLFGVSTDYLLKDEEGDRGSFEAE
ncbi:MAG: helix-turn-helix transcriptional regulator, partial [Lachnospiraceae bacterium]|nr:helix-turn-helix transcriptional regulator [Lachnospiraceae bacterium]